MLSMFTDVLAVQMRTARCMCVGSTCRKFRGPTRPAPMPRARWTLLETFW